MKNFRKFNMFIVVTQIEATKSYYITCLDFENFFFFKQVILHQNCKFWESLVKKVKSIKLLIFSHAIFGHIEEGNISFYF